MGEVLTQIWLLVDCLKKKKELLTLSYEITKYQTMLIQEVPEDNTSFNDAVIEKKNNIDKINELDAIFASIYDRIKDKMGKSNSAHREPMLLMQDLIKEVTQLVVDIKVLEEKNHRYLTGGVQKVSSKKIDTNSAFLAYKKQKKF